MNNDRFKFRVPYFKNNEFDGFVYFEAGYDCQKPSDHGYLGQREQCVGLKDKNGRPIYEGDIIGGLFGGYIKWCDSCKSFEMFFGDECGSCNRDICWYEIVEDDGKLEVIDNIHENPELVK